MCLMDGVGTHFTVELAFLYRGQDFGGDQAVAMEVVVSKAAWTQMSKEGGHSLLFSQSVKPDTNEPSNMSHTGNTHHLHKACNAWVQISSWAS